MNYQNHDCPICYELIPHHINCVTTECGHSFHTTCLMKHTVYNGYDCPCCRTLLAAQPKGTHTTVHHIRSYNDENNSVSDTSLDERRTYYEDDEIEEAPRPIYDDYVLDGCRWMFQRVATGYTEDAEDPYTDAFETWQIQMNQNCREFQTEVDRRADVILDVLNKIKAFSHDDLVKGYLFCIDEYFGGSTEFARYDQKVTSTLKSILDKSGIMSSPFRPRPSFM